MVKDAVSKSDFTWTMSELEQVIDRIVKSFTPTAAQGCFSVASYYRGLCTLGMPFQGKMLSPFLNDIAEVAAINSPAQIFPNYDPFSKLPLLSPVSLPSCFLTVDNVDLE